MGRFSELTKLPYGPPSHAAQSQLENRKKFQVELSRSSFRMENRPHPDPATVYLLIGAATWNNYDMNLLDQIEPLVGKIYPARLTVAVFDIDECKTGPDVSDIFPGIGNVPQTPAVGLWVNGICVETASGYYGRKLIERVVSAELQVQPYRESLIARASESLVSA